MRPDIHFLYRVPGAPSKSKQRVDSDTDLQWLTYQQWLEKANVMEDLSDPSHEHWYFRLIGCGSAMGNHGTCDKGSSQYLFDE
jgi:hypothetical protein